MSGDKKKFSPHLLATACATTLLVVACGGSDNDDSSGETPVKPTVGEAACHALAGKKVAATAFGEASGEASLDSAVFTVAVADAQNTAGTAVVQATPDYCKVLATIKPVDPSAPLINVQVNLPSAWNNKFLQFGGSGYNGALVTGLDGVRLAGPDTPRPITQGYMTAGTDSGHQNATGVEAQAFALNAEALRNFAYASYNKTHDLAVEVAQLYYGAKPGTTYYMGGSEGGREGMTMAQRYPEDYDGIISIDPVMNWSGLQTFGNDVGGVLQSKPSAWLGTKVQRVHDTVVAACDKLDGLADGVISNYNACGAVARPALEALRCSDGNDSGAACLSDAQLDVVRAAHSGYTFNFPLANNMTHYAGFAYGGEGLPSNWSAWMTGSKAPVFSAAPNETGVGNLFAYGNGYIRYFIAQDKDFNPLGYNPDTYRSRVQEVSSMMDATNPDLSRFYARGGKLILRENLADTAQSPRTGLNYWDSVVSTMGRETVEKFFIAYAATGLPHTSPGIAAGAQNAPAYGIPGQQDLLSLLDKWVKEGSKPADNLTLSSYEPLPPYAVKASKPMCRYPSYPQYVAGDVTVAASYRCALQ